MSIKQSAELDSSGNAKLAYFQILDAYLDIAFLCVCFFFFALQIAIRQFVPHENSRRLCFGEGPWSGSGFVYA